MKAEDRWKCSDKHPQYQCDEVAQVRAALWSQAIALLRQVVADESESRGYAQGGLSDATLAKIEKYLDGGDEASPALGRQGYRSLSGGVYDCRTKEEGGLEVLSGGENMEHGQKMRVKVVTEDVLNEVKAQLVASQSYLVMVHQGSTPIHFTTGFADDAECTTCALIRENKRVLEQK